jgi:arylsulfotransferase ASST
VYSRIRRGLCALAVLTVAVSTSAAAAQAQDLAVSAQSALYPAFSPDVSDYVTRCAAGTPIDVNVSAPAGMSVNVDGQGARAGDYTTQVGIKPGQSFRIVEGAGARAETYHVRCLPADFPAWTFQRTGQPGAEWYAVAPFARSNFQPLPPGVSPNYVALLDGNGVPVWWMKTGLLPLDFHPLSNGDVVWTNFSVPSSEEHRLDGSLVHTLTGVGPDFRSDEHETLLLPNGNYLLIVERDIPGFDFCGLTNQKIVDYGFQEIGPAGSVVKQWFASDHIPMTEVPEAWCGTILNTSAGGAFDVYHANSLEPNGDGILISFRHLDAVYRVNSIDGHVEWKLGGTPIAQSLIVRNDPLSAGNDLFRGQHDARVLSDGTVTIHDNGFHPSSSRAGRAVRYSIDSGAGTATLVEQKNDPTGTTTPLCCGSARRLPDGHWLMSWGSAGLVTELSASGSRVFSLTFDDGLFSYRAHPVLFGTLSRTALRNGMDAQYPRGYPRPRSAAQIRVPLVPEFKECLAPDQQHGEPFAFGSCSHPASTSSYLTVGTPDANGQFTNSAGHVTYKVHVGNPATPASESDVSMTVELTDVRRAADLSDYTGELQARGAVRITDRLNGSLHNEAATGFDTDFPATVPCTATDNPISGSTCSLSTTFNALVAGTVVEGKRANWQLGKIQLFDGGASGLAGATGASPFVTQGLFIP